MIDVYDIIKNLYDAYGKSYNEKQIVVYTDWAKTCSITGLSKVINTWIDGEKFFPSLADLKRLYGALNKERSNPLEYDECWYCGGSGFVPAIEKHEDRDVLVNYKCKCSNAVMIAPEYFRAYPEIQLKQFSQGFSDEMNYPQIVDRYFKEVTRSIGL